MADGDVGKGDRLVDTGGSIRRFVVDGDLGDAEDVGEREGEHEHEHEHVHAAYWVRKELADGDHDGDDASEDEEAVVVDVVDDVGTLQLQASHPLQLEGNTCAAEIAPVDAGNTPQRAWQPSEIENAAVAAEKQLASARLAELHRDECVDGMKQNEVTRWSCLVAARREQAGCSTLLGMGMGTGTARMKS